MSKKKAGQKKPADSRPKRWKKRKNAIAIALILSLSIAVTILAQWRSVRSSFNPLVPVPTPTPTAQLSKEYIYAGGKLVATEEPGSGGGTSPLSQPSALIATGTSAPQINLSWTASTGGTVDHYQVERMQSLSSGYTVVNPNVPATSYTDVSVSSGTAYLYKVRAVDSQGNFTNYSNVDLATTITFDNDPLVSYAEDPNNATPIRAVHFTQLRDAVNAVRRLVDPNASPFNWTDTIHPPQVGGSIYASHLTDLRTYLSAALLALNLPATNYQYPTITAHVSPIHKADIQELRNAVK
ncbi:MAG TPA: fibronectin type III domain-containing protein [Pyrinomonadaceae bacterium]|jgi:hypothetical protein|nr:fibronectin type III domain-containing protein [Pyrinomonadaceae bacterium]